MASAARFCAVAHFTADEAAPPETLRVMRLQRPRTAWTPSPRRRTPTPTTPKSPPARPAPTAAAGGGERPSTLPAAFGRPGLKAGWIN
ncbi:hypothetical protein ACQJBY_056951 [Aegilops geniculata]